MAITAQSLGLEFTTLNNHIGEIITCTFLFIGIYLISYFLSQLLFPLAFPTKSNKQSRFQSPIAWIFPNQLDQSSQVKFHAQLVSLIHALVAVPFALQILLSPPTALKNNPLFGYDRWAASAYSWSTGYFIWDVGMSLIHYKTFGTGFLVHAISCSLVFLFSFKPILNYYGAAFLLYEISTPFLNIHQFMEKSVFKNTKAQLVNGALFISSFAISRVIFGMYFSLQVFFQFWKNLANVPFLYTILYLGSNIVLNVLNLVWLSKTVSSLNRRLASVKIEKCVSEEKHIQEKTENLTTTHHRSIKKTAILQNDDE